MLPRFLWLAPAALALVLSLPGFNRPFLFDDFDFLGRVQEFHLWKLLPDPGVIFWRPISRELFFRLVYSLGDAGPIAGHVLNVLFLAIACLLLFRIGSYLGGFRTGFFASLIFSTFSQLPLLTSWLSGSQDLLAIVFILLAIDLRLNERLWPAAAAITLALLSKETAFAFIPLLIAQDRLLQRRPYRILYGTNLYGSIALAWAAFHPGIRALFVGGLGRTPEGYVGFDIPDRLASVFKSLVTLLNLPISGLRTPLSGLPWLAFLAALAVLLAVWVCLRDARGQATASPAASTARSSIAMGAAMCLLPFVMTHAIVRGWAAYYSCIPFLGIALAVGAYVVRLSLPRALAVVTVLLCLGFWSRNLVLDSRLPCERNMRPAAIALRKVESGFKDLYRSVPPQTDLLVSVQSVGAASVYLHLYRFQALRIWYRDPTLMTHRPDFPISGERPRLLFWVAPDFRVSEISLETFKNRPIGNEIAFQQYKKTLRYYARGLAAGGDVVRAAIILLKIPETDPVLRGIDLRVAAMFFIYKGRNRDAQMLLERVPPLPLEARVAGIGAVLTFSPSELVLDDAALISFEIARSDLNSLLALGRRFATDDRSDLAARFGDRVLQLDPTNAEAIKWIHDAKTLPPRGKLTQSIGEGVDTPFDQ